MPLGDYVDWNACIKDQKNKGHNQNSAEKICGKIKSITEKQMTTKDLLQRANEQIEKSRLVMKKPKEDSNHTIGGVKNTSSGTIKPGKAGKIKEVRRTYKNETDEISGEIKKFCAYCGNGLQHEDELIEKATLPIQLFKSDREEDEQYVLGVVLEPETEDAQGDIYSADEIRKSAYTFMENFGDMGLQHNGIVNDQIKILETYIAPMDFEIEGQKIQKGTWMLGARIVDDVLWQDVKKGTLTGWSIGGSAIKTPV
jgi:hypothetical protein